MLHRRNAHRRNISVRGKRSLMPRRGFSGVTAFAGLTLIYFLAGKLGLKLAFLHASASPVWPPAGIALGALLVFGYRTWPAIFVGAFLVNVTTVGNFETSLAIGAGNTLEARSEEHTSELQSLA